MSFDFKLKRALGGLSGPRRLWAPLWMGPLHPDGIQELFGCPVDPEELYAETLASWEACESPHTLDKLTCWFVELYLQNNILPKVDRSSMLCSLEVRSPFLDIDLVNFCRTLPATARLRHGRKTKAVLRHAGRACLPQAVLARSKQGFALPVGAWFREGNLRVSGSPELTNATAVRQRSAAHEEGQRDERLFLYSQWAFERFLEGRP